ncbi:MAG: lytic murein transglycosylase [Rickettsiales bacterium]
MKNISLLYFISLTFIMIIGSSFSGSAASESSNKYPFIKNTQPLSAWISELDEELRGNGISGNLVKDSFDGFTPIERVIELDRKQPEGTMTLDEYLKKVISKKRIEDGRAEFSRNKKSLNKVAKKYGIPPEVIVALWGIETNYGSNIGNFNTIHALATLAYDGRRSEFFRKELINAFKIMEAEKMNSDGFIGSWAGAFGQCQFMPSSYLRYAVDFDGDGRRDIWDTPEDIFASIANYLAKEGWDSKYSGVGKEGSHNFNVVLRWNRSRYFATAVSNLSKAIKASN